MQDIPCPHCGQSNEVEREVCWACFKALKPGEAKPRETAPGIRLTAGTKIVVDGREYSSLADVPEPFRSTLTSSLQSAQEGMRSGKRSRIVVNGAEYDRIEDVPEPLRSRLVEGLSRAKPDVIKVTKIIKRSED